MRISVVLPVYVFSNDLINFTKDCLLSLEGQYDEMIIIDNNSPLLGEEWQKRATTYIRNKTNLGFGAAANQGFKLATGDYICFLGHHLVETLNGTKKIRNIQVGEMVKTHRGKFKPVVAVIKRAYAQRQPLIQIETSSSGKNGSIRCTPEHPFLTSRDGKKEWIRAKRLNKNDKLLYPYREEGRDKLLFGCYANATINDQTVRGDDKRKVFFDYVVVDQLLARFLGFYLAEGCSLHDGISFTFSDKEKVYVSFVKKVCLGKFHRKPTVITRRGATTVKLNIRSFGKLFKKWFGHKAPNKRIPSFVFEWSLLNRLAFIEGYVCGDGTNHGGGKTIGTASKNLVKDFKKLCCLSGINTGKAIKVATKTTAFWGRLIKSKEFYQVSICKQNWIKLNDLMVAQKKSGYLEISINSVEGKRMPSYPKVRQYVYNLEVEEDNSYIVNSVIVHNCLVTNDTRLQKGNLKDLCGAANQGYSFPRITGKEFPEWDGAFFMFSRKVMEKNGIYDEQFFPGYFEDSDLFYRATLKKLKLTRVDSVEVLHHQSQTSKPMGVRQTAYDACRDKFKEKWGFDFIERMWLK